MCCEIKEFLPQKKGILFSDVMFCSSNSDRWKHTSTFSSFAPSQVGGVCRLSTESSLRRCRTPDAKICSGRGKCDCGICICRATDPGKFYGPLCECHDWVCPSHNGKPCNGGYHNILNTLPNNINHHL